MLSIIKKSCNYILKLIDYKNYARSFGEEFLALPRDFISFLFSHLNTQIFQQLKTSMVNISSRKVRTFVLYGR